VEEYNRMKQEELGRNREDMADEIVVGTNNSLTINPAFNGSIQTISNNELNNNSLKMSSLNEKSEGSSSGHSPSPGTKLFKK
jgi:hypothetical protein